MNGTLRRLMELLLTGLCAASAAHAQAAPSDTYGALYTVGNETDGNTVIAFQRGIDGRLSPAGQFRTGGLGTGAGLGNQGALALNEDATRLFVVNAGSDDISAFHVRRDNSLSLIETMPSGGDLPISLTIDDEVLYVLNAESDSISGFRARLTGLTAIPRSNRPLSGSNTGPAQISFSPDGRTLAITEKDTNNLVLYAVDQRGRPEPTPSIVPSLGETPFGFGFNARRQLIVSEAFGGAEGESAVSSYLLRRDGKLEVVSSSIPTNQTAACWIVTTPNRLFAYTTNTGSGTISGYRIEPGGALTRFDDGGVTADLGADSAPLDMAISPDGKFLYSLNSGTQTVSLMRIRDDGTLSLLETTGGLTVGATGLVVR